MRLFTLEEKMQLTKWYFQGKTERDMFDLYISEYAKKRGVEPSIKSITHPGKVFEKNCCIYGHCKNCNGRSLKRVMSDKRELNEIMVCAAAELELSTSDISLELEIAERTVSNILRRNGYSLMSLFEESSKKETRSEKVPPEKLQIIKWYCQGKSFLDIMQLYNDNFKQIHELKQEILKTILQFEKYECLHNCEMCTQKMDKSKENLKIQDIEGLIIKQVNELNDKNLLPQKSLNTKIKLECYSETTVLSKNGINIDSKNSNFPKDMAKNIKNSVKRKLQEKIEFVSVEPTVNGIIAEKIDERKKKRLSS